MLKHVNNLKTRSEDGISRIWYTPYKQYYTRDIHLDMQPELAKTLPVWLNFVNDEHCFNKYYRHREASEVFAIDLVLEGSMWFIQNGKKYHVTAGSAFLVHQDRDNEYTTGPEGHCHRLACSLSGDELNGLLCVTRLIEHDVIKLNNLDAVKKTMQTCFEELMQKKPGFRRRASILCYKLLVELEENIQQMNTPDLLIRAIDLMNHCLSQHLSVNKIISSLNTSPTTLNAMFQRHFEISPIKYFIGLKMEAAKSLLANTNRQIQEVAQATGYSDPLYFSAEFKKRIGLSPKKYRQNTQTKIK